MSEAFILISTNPQNDKTLFIDLPVQYMKTTTSEHVVYTNCFLFFFWHSEQFMYITCSELVIFMYWTGKSMNNLLSNCGLVDPRINTSDKDLPVNKKKSGFVKLGVQWAERDNSRQIPLTFETLKREIQKYYNSFANVRFFWFKHLKKCFS